MDKSTELLIKQLYKIEFKPLSINIGDIIHFEYVQTTNTKDRHPIVMVIKPPEIKKNIAVVEGFNFNHIPNVNARDPKLGKDISFKLWMYKELKRTLSERINPYASPYIRQEYKAICYRSYQLNNIQYETIKVIPEVQELQYIMNPTMLINISKNTTSNSKEIKTNV